MPRRFHSPGPGRPGPLSRNASADPAAPSVQLWETTEPPLEHPEAEAAASPALTSRGLTPRGLAPGVLDRPGR